MSGQAVPLLWNSNRSLPWAISTVECSKVYYGVCLRSLATTSRHQQLSFKCLRPNSIDFKYFPSNQRLLRGNLSVRCSSDLKSDSEQENSNILSDSKSPSFESKIDATSLGELGYSEATMFGEDAAVFEFSKQKLLSWIYFSIILAVVSIVLYFAWIDSATGYGDEYIQAVSSISTNTEVVMLGILAVFAVAHSGLASLRDRGEKLIGERAYRVLFASVSLPLAVSAVVYFINHRYDGAQLWEVRGIPGMHEFVWILSFVSFLFLYPSTFNLLEVAAVDKPKMHLYETGIMRITRHPQMFGQFLWCLAHTLWIGNSFMLTTSIGLLAHHLFGVWNGDRRLAKRYGNAFEQVKRRTSIVPFSAILDGRQELPKDYYKEFLRGPYFLIVILTLGAYFFHPSLQGASYHLPW